MSQPIGRRALAFVPEADGPHVRLGVGWAVLTAAAALAGTVVLAVWLAAVAGVAAAQASRLLRPKAKPFPALAAVALPLSATGGGGVLALCLAILALALFAGRLASRLAGVRRPRSLTSVRVAAVAIAMGMAAAGPVLARTHSLAEPLVLLALVATYDAGAYLVGTGAGRVWEGPVAGIAAIASVSLAVAAVVDPPFRGASPWLLGGLVAVLAPLGPIIASALLGDARLRVPGVRRLDSLLLVSPAWGLAAASLLRR